MNRDDLANLERPKGPQSVVYLGGMRDRQWEMVEELTSTRECPIIYFEHTFHRDGTVTPESQPVQMRVQRYRLQPRVVWCYVYEGEEAEGAEDEHRMDRL